MIDLNKEEAISEVEEHEYMGDTLQDLNSEYDSHEKYEEGKEFVEENFWAKLEKVGTKLSFLKDIKALFNYMLNSDVPWYRKAVVVGALIYFISPLDSVPDFIPFAGYLDDLGVITTVLKFLGKELNAFYDEV
jgi:uncharacterized membrane protein YkvA (DUF1232 family)